MPLATPENTSGNEAIVVTESQFNEGSNQGHAEQLVKLIWILQNQLTMSIEKSTDDYMTIVNYCSEKLAEETPDVAGRLITAMQYRDRASQRVFHVVRRLEELALHLLRQDWKAVSSELSVEADLAQSFYHAEELEEFMKLASNIGGAARSDQCGIEKRGSSTPLSDPSAKTNAVDDDSIDLFDL